MTRIYDLDGTPRDAAWLKATYGAFLAPCGATAGTYIALDEVRIQEGPAVCTVEVKAQDSAPLPGYLVAFSWPDAPVDLTIPEAQVFKTRYRNRAAVQETVNPNGDTCFGLGLGSYIANLETGGPHAVWILSDKYPSDALDGIGMLGGTNHRGPLKLAFKLATVTTPPPPDDGTPQPSGNELARIATALERQAEAQEWMADRLDHIDDLLTWFTHYQG